jgi:hypothetical protein
MKTIASIFPKLFGAKIPESDPQSALPELANALARQHTLPPERVLNCLQRLMTAETCGHELTKTQFYRAFLRGLPGLLTAALARMPPEYAIEFCETEDLLAYRRRDQIAHVLANTFTPLYSLDELGCLLSEFVHHQELNRRSLLSTGLPNTFFNLSPWVDVHLNKLYFTKLPVSLRQRWGLLDDRSSSNHPTRPRPAYPRACVDWRRIADRISVMRSGFLDANLWNQYPLQPNPACRWEWARWQHDIWHCCDYEDADLLDGLSEEAGTRLATLRPSIFDTKCQVLGSLASALRECNHQTLWQKCLDDITRRISGDDADFLLRMDMFFAGYEIRSTQKESKTLPLLCGGLTNLFELIGHVEKELVIGTMTKTREALGDAVIVDELRRPHFATELNPRSVRYGSRHAYLNLVAAGRGDQIRSASDLCSHLDSEEPAFWSQFRQRAADALSSEFSGLVGVKLQRKFQPVLQPLLQQYADRWVHEQEQSTKIKQPTAKFPVLADLHWAEVTIVFTSNDTIRVSARGVVKDFHYSEIGFKDERKNVQPNSRWLALKQFARQDGTVRWDTDISREEKRALKTAVKNLRNYLKAFIGIGDDPFHPYHDAKAYSTRFKLRDESFSDVDGESVVD